MILAVEPWTIVTSPEGKDYIVEPYAYGDPAPAPDQWRNPFTAGRWLADLVKAARAGPGRWVVVARPWPGPSMPKSKWRRVAETKEAAEQIANAVADDLRTGAWTPRRGEPAL